MLGAALFLLGSSVVVAQNINSPYSRYGIGDLTPNQNMLTRGMGGASTAYADYQSVNYANPASYGHLQSVTYDVGAEINNLAIRSLNPIRKFSNASPNISYINLGVPLKRSGGWGLVFGLRPISRINYKLLRNERIQMSGGSDSVSTVFEGIGGSQQAYLGTGFKWGHLTAGINAGFMFGSKDYSTRRVFLNDTLAYFKSNHEIKSNFHGLLYNAGLQYDIKLSSKTQVRFGLQGSWNQTLKGTRDVIRETYNYDANGAEYTIDSVYKVIDIAGDVKMPNNYSAGVLLEKFGKWMINVDYLSTKWSEYSYFGEKDQVNDNWEFRMGAQLVPEGGQKYWSNVAYRTGFSYGKDYVKVGEQLNRWTFTFGAGLPMRRVAYTNQFSIINTVVEIGQRGNVNSLVRENFFRLGIGLSMSDVWFIKRKYD
jgi:hypothetical protein